VGEQTSPCLLLVYAIPATVGEISAVLATLMITPPVPSFMKGMTERIILTWTVRFVARTASQASSAMLSTLSKSSIGPATLTRTSIRGLYGGPVS
jgi:hypothetical protein